MLEPRGFFALVCLLVAITASLAQIPQMLILPPQQHQTKAIGRTVLLTCRIEADDRNHITDFKWTDPQGNEVRSERDQASSNAYVQAMPGEISLALIISSLRETDAGLYTCSAMYTRTELLKKSVTIDTVEPITWVDTPEDQFPIINTDYKIKCLVKANPSPMVDWLRQGELISSKGRYVVEPDGLLIKSVTESDEGDYVCRAIVINTGELAERRIRVEVYEPPEFEEELASVEAVEGRPASMVCRAKGKPEPQYTWIKSDTQKDLSTVNRFSVDVNHGILSIERVEQEDHGQYTCVAKNDAASVQARAMLTVIVLPKIVEFNNVSVPVEQDATMVCKVSGRPLPSEVTFRKLSSKNVFSQGVQAADERIYINRFEDKGEAIATLKINNVLRSDDGLYECIARNSGGEVTRIGHLTVEFAPSFANTPVKEAWSWDSNPVNITCLAESIPNATISWKLQGRDIVEDQNIRKYGGGPESTLEVKPIGVQYYGVYTCKASNVHGEMSHSIQLKEARIPGEILQAKLDIITATTITFSFIGPSDNGGLPVKAYAVQYKEDRQNWETDENKQVWLLDSPYILENLEPQTTYNFRFAARNDVGFGPWGANQQYTMPKRSYPEEPRILDTAIEGIVMSPYKDYYELRWNIPADNGEIIDKFEIKYCPARNSTEGWKENGKCELTYQEHPGNPVYRLVDLKPETYYKIEIRAHNGIGFSTPGQVIVKTARDPTRTGILHSGPSSASSSTTTAGAENLVSAEHTALSSGAIVSIVVAALFVILVIVDVSCYFATNTSVMMLLCKKARGNARDEESKTASGEKEPLKDAHMDTTDGPENNGKHISERDPVIKDGLNKDKKETSVEYDVKNSSSKISIAKDSPV